MTSASADYIMEMCVCEANGTELHQLGTIYKECFPQDGESRLGLAACVAYLRGFLEHGSCRVLVCRAGQAVQGFAILALDREAPPPRGPLLRDAGGRGALLRAAVRAPLWGPQAALRARHRAAERQALNRAVSDALARRFPGHRVGWIELVAVKRGARGTGVGSRLLSGCIHVAAQHGLTCVGAKVAMTNVASNRLFEGTGFCRILAFDGAWVYARLCAPLHSGGEETCGTGRSPRRIVKWARKGRERLSARTTQASEYVDVSVVVVSYSTREVLAECLRSVFEQAGDVRFEVVVVDNASADGSADMVARDFPQVHLIRNAENRGFAAGCNQGIRVARGRYVLLLNSDAVVLNGAISKTVAYADDHPAAAVVGCQVLLDDGSVQGTCFRYPSISNLVLSTLGLDRLPFGRRLFGREWMRDWSRDTEREVEVVTGSYMVVRRDAIRQVGVMDEAYFVYAEEADWCYRFRKAGWRVLFTPSAQVVHVHGGGQSAGQQFVRMQVQLRKSTLLFFEKHYGPASRACANALMALSALWHAAGLAALRVGMRLKGREDTAGQRRAAYWAALKFHLWGVEPRPS